MLDIPPKRTDFQRATWSYIPEEARQETSLKKETCFFSLGLFFHPEDGCDIFLRNIS
jgi:hypothetical protein